jgi:hypothetical protein
MRFVSAAACSAALATALLALSSACASAAPGVVNTTVNLRQGPGTTTEIVTKIPGGSAVDVAGCSGEWCQVSYAGKKGYVIATALGQGGPPPAAGGPPPGAPPPGYVPPPGYIPPPVYAGPPPYPYGYYGPYYGGPYYYGGGCCWRGGWGRRW